MKFDLKTHRETKKESVNVNGFVRNCKKLGYCGIGRLFTAGVLGELMITPVDAVALFMLGFLGTGHCIGMCGPLVVALPGQTGRFSGHLAYHAGRLVTYGILGALMGGAGSGLIHLAAVIGGNPLVWMARIQVGISLLAGLFLLFFGLSRLGFIPEPRWLVIALPNRMPGWRYLMSKAAGQRTDFDLFFMGLILGGLPCGLSYAAFTKALSSAQIPSGAAMALIFGLGTLPGLLAVGAGAAVFLNRFRQQADILAGLIMVGMAATMLVKVLEVVAG